MVRQQRALALKVYSRNTLNIREVNKDTGSVALVYGRINNGLAIW